MTSQPPQRPRRNASPRSGPMRAIVPFSLRQNTTSPTRAISNNGRRTSPAPISNSSTVSDNHRVKHHRSPDQRASPERSPSSPGFRVEKPKAVRVSPGPAIRRTSSLDTITAPYLSGQWPKEPVSTHGSSSSGGSSGGGSSGAYEPNQMHQSTQTEDHERPGSSHKRSSSLGSADNLKEKYRQQLRKQGSRQSSTNQRASPVHGYHSYQQAPPSPSPGVYSARSSAISIPTSSLKPPSPKILRGSVEGLNQEIEKLVLNSGFDLEDERIGEIDGHRAPVPGTSKRSVDTQTPRESQEDSPCNGSSSSQSPSSPSDRSRPSSGSSSAGNVDSKEVKEVPDGSPELTWGARISSSPSHNKSWQLTRDPPDGCEKVKTMDDPSPKHKSLDPAPITHHCPDKMLYIPLKPSDSSAFCPLPNFPLRDFKAAFNIPPITTAVAQTQTNSEEQP